MSKSDRTNTDRKDGVPRTLTSIPLTDPHAPSAEPSIGELVKEATAQAATKAAASPSSRRHVLCTAILPSTQKRTLTLKRPRQSNVISAHQRGS